MHGARAASECNIIDCNLSFLFLRRDVGLRDEANTMENGRPQWLPRKLWQQEEDEMLMICSVAHHSKRGGG